MIEIITTEPENYVDIKDQYQQDRIYLEQVKKDTLEIYDDTEQTRSICANYLNQTIALKDEARGYRDETISIKNETNTIKNQTNDIKNQTQSIATSISVPSGAIAAEEITVTSDGQTTFSAQNVKVIAVIISGGWFFATSRTSTTFTIPANDLKAGMKILAILQKG